MRGIAQQSNAVSFDQFVGGRELSTGKSSLIRGESFVSSSLQATRLGPVPQVFTLSRFGFNVRTSLIPVFVQV